MFRQEAAGSRSFGIGTAVVASVIGTLVIAGSAYYGARWQQASEVNLKKHKRGQKHKHTVVININGVRASDVEIAPQTTEKPVPPASLPPTSGNTLSSVSKSLEPLPLSIIDHNQIQPPFELPATPLTNYSSFDDTFIPDNESQTTARVPDNGPYMSAANGPIPNQSTSIESTQQESDITTINTSKENAGQQGLTTLSDVQSLNNEVGMLQFTVYTLRGQLSASEGRRDELEDRLTQLQARITELEAAAKHDKLVLDGVTRQLHRQADQANKLTADLTQERDQLLHDLEHARRVQAGNQHRIQVAEGKKRAADYLLSTARALRDNWHQLADRLTDELKEAKEAAECKSDSGVDIDGESDSGSEINSKPTSCSKPSGHRNDEEVEDEEDEPSEAEIDLSDDPLPDALELPQTRMQGFKAKGLVKIKSLKRGASGPVGVFSYGHRLLVRKHITLLPLQNWKEYPGLDLIAWEYYLLNRVLPSHEHLVKLVHYRQFRPQKSEMYTAELYFDYCSGGDLSEMANALEQIGSGLDETVIWTLLWQIGGALLAMHGYDVSHEPASIKETMRTAVVHGDIKPCNIFLKDPALVTSRGLQFVLGDVGISTPASTSYSSFGTPPWMAPEVFEVYDVTRRLGDDDVKAHWAGTKVVTAASDVWSLGTTLFQMLTGGLPSNLTSIKPVAGDTLKLELRRKDGLTATCSKVLVTTLQSMMRVNQEDRPTGTALARLVNLAHSQASDERTSFLKDKYLYMTGEGRSWRLAFAAPFARPEL